jgi:ER-bound oxygenase mpaB/B'/Rubber oxygenase, catalytic domain
MTRTPSSAIPNRHPDKRAQAPLLGPLGKLLGIAPASDAQWRAIGEALTRGDEPMDELVEWMYSAGMDVTRPLFDKALADGVHAVPDAPEPLRAFFDGVEAVPSWVDWDRIRLGERAFQRSGIDGVYLARCVPFLGGFAVSGINRTLMLTNTGKSGATGGGQRFAETMQWALAVISDGGMTPGGPGYRATLHVRLIHAFVRRHIGRLPEWREPEWGVPVNQTDMAATMLGALFAPVVAGLAMGMICTPKELDGIVHLTRYTGWLMGIEERYLPTGFREATTQLYHYLTALNAPDETSRQLAQPMADDPLRWHYPSFAPIRRRIAWAQQLSITRAFIGGRAMRQLGLPTYVLPWYPALRIPVNVVRTSASIALPGGRNRAARAGLRQQRAFLTTLIGPKADAAIGDSANYVHQVA